MTDLVFHSDRAEEILLEVHDAYLKQQFLYSRVRSESAPQNVCIPKGADLGSSAHSLYLYFTTIITYASDSDEVFRQSLRLFEDHPYLFSDRLLEMEVWEVEERLRRVGFVRPGQGAHRWHGSGTTFFQEYDGDPLRFLDVQSVDEFLCEKRKLQKRYGREAFPGVGPKIFSLMALFFEELGLIQEMPGAFPVDLHVQRFCISTGIVEGQGLVYAATTLAELLRRELYRICCKYGMRPLDLSHALWLLGHLVCTVCPQVNGIEYVCPAFQYCGGAPPSLIYSRKGKWDFDAPRLPKGSQQSAFQEVVLDAAKHGRRMKLRKAYDGNMVSQSSPIQKVEQFSLFENSTRGSISAAGWRRQSQEREEKE